MYLVALLASSAWALDLVWVGPVPPDAAEIAARVGASPTARTRLDLRAALEPAESDALSGLERALEEARPFESRLDGELTILQLVESAVQGVHILHNEAEATALFRALAYQGFAANRYFGGAFPTDPEAEPWRASLASGAVERPWLDAVGLAPDREATAYEIAEAPQRVAFNLARRRILEVAPSVVDLPVLPAEATVFVDGRPHAGGAITLVPGRHFVHAEVEGRIVEHWDFRVGSAERRALEARVDQPTFDAFLADLHAGSPVPSSLAPLLRSLGDVALATVDGDGKVRLFDPSSGALSTIKVPRGTGGVSFEAHTGLHSGWFSSADFYLQAPATHPATFGTVNAIQVGGYATGEVVVGRAHIGVGLDILAPLGDAHVALSGETRTRVRFVPHVAVGLPWLQATAGFLFPYHPAVGGRLRAPLGDTLELQAAGWWGPPTSRVRSDGTVWDGSAVLSVTGGIGARFGAPR